MSNLLLRYISAVGDATGALRWSPLVGYRMKSPSLARKEQISRSRSREAWSHPGKWFASTNDDFTLKRCAGRGRLAWPGLAWPRVLPLLERLADTIKACALSLATCPSVQRLVASGSEVNDAFHGLGIPGSFVEGFGSGCGFGSFNLFLLKKSTVSVLEAHACCAFVNDRVLITGCCKES